MNRWFWSVLLLSLLFSLQNCSSSNSSNDAVQQQDVASTPDAADSAAPDLVTSQDTNTPLPDKSEPQDTNEPQDSTSDSPTEDQTPIDQLVPQPDLSGNDTNTQPKTYPGFFPIDCKHLGSGTDYQVGPGKAYTSLAGVPWNDLKAGDTVRIFWRAEPYREKIILRGKGTKEQPIRVCGVAGSEGQLPVLSGENATTQKELNFGGWRPMQDLGLVTIFHNDYTTKPAHIVVEGLALTDANPTNTYSGTDGVVGSWSQGAACIWIQEGDFITLRGNTVTNCGNGIFALSKSDNEASVVRNVLIEGNYIYGNGVDGSDRQHNLYVQAIGATYQYNYFGRTLASSSGANLKDRSAGSIIRYNWIEGSARPIDLVEVQEHYQFVIGVAGTDELYRQSFVYGNLIRLEGANDGIFAVHYGYDSIPEYTRKGTLWCFNNTFIFRKNQSDHWRVHVLDLSTLEEKAEFFNNVVLIEPETNGVTPSNLNIMRSSGIVNLGKNLISSGYKDGRDDGNWVVNGKTNLIETALPIGQVLNLETLFPVANSPALDQGVALPGSLNSHPLLYQYKKHQQGMDRKVCNGTADFGALELCPQD